MDNIYFLGNEKYTKKIFINNGRLFSQNILQEDAISPMENIDYIFSAYPYDSQKYIIFFKENKENICAAVINNDKITAKSTLLNNAIPQNTACAYFNQKMYIFITQNENIDLYTISSQRPIKESIFENIHPKDIKISCGSFIYAAALTEKTIELYNPVTRSHTAAKDKCLHSMSLCQHKETAYIMAVTNKNAFVYIWHDDTIERHMVFNGNKIENCSIFIKNGILYACALSEGKIYYRHSSLPFNYFSPMGTIPLYGKCTLEKGYFFQNNTYAQDFYAINQRAVSELYPFLYKENIFIEKADNKDNKAIIETLSRDISAMSSQNSILNQRYKAAEERYISQISELEETITSLQNKNDYLLKEMEELKNALKTAQKEASHAVKEKEVLKKAKKLLEEEIYALNNPSEEKNESTE